MAKPKAKKTIRVEDLRVRRGGAIQVKGGSPKKVGYNPKNQPGPTPTPTSTPTPTPTSS